ncbi:hypothetical protein EDE04_0138 [Streptomyces sp. 2132.2]|uniref:DUF7919 family protein n=1 Tax=Streptomyces sp. 2132.2 TaxID=2485161 RepID=UPI000F47CA03|nr:hypothetical protein [Streptomyces sp. 2132.2]ROQ93735.1 hypothetical protein EDE04_0138 [Streptomyces sp. 2132.2]
MFYADLSSYTYWDEGEEFTDLTDGMRSVRFQPVYERFNIGWLEAGLSWTSGEAPREFGRRLLAVIDAQQVNVMSGLHECDLCPTPLPDSHPWYSPRPGDLRASAGTGEIRIPGSPGTVFASPSLIGHYVVDHSYLPPQPFIEAVLAFDPYGAWQARFPGIRFPWVPKDAILRHVDEA